MKARIGAIAYCSRKKLGLITGHNKKGWRGVQLMPEPGAAWSSKDPKVVGGLTEKAAKDVAEFVKVSLLLPTDFHIALTDMDAEQHDK